MSEQKDGKESQVVDKGEASSTGSTSIATGGEAAALEMNNAAAAAPVQAAAPAPRKASSAIAWLSLLLVLALGGATGWLVMEAQRREAQVVGREGELRSRLADVEAIAAKKQANLEELGEQWKQQLDAGLQGAGAESSQLAQAIVAIEAQLAEQRTEMARYSAHDRQSWLVAEAEYLLRLANQRIIMAGDTTAAQALLKNADDIFLELDDVRLHPVRAAVASDLAAVRAVPSVDVEGIYLRLAALVEQAGKLRIFQLPEPEARLSEEAAPDWQDRLRQGYEDALLKLSDYIVIRRRDVPMQALMDPQWEGLVRQNLRMLFEQAQVALLSGNEVLYRESLQRAQHWVAEFFESDEAASRAMAREITQLEDADIASAMPDISRSLQALDDARKEQLQQGGAE